MVVVPLGPYTSTGRIRTPEALLPSLKTEMPRNSVSNIDVPVGDVSLRYEFVPTGPVRFGEGKGPAGNATLYIDDQLVGAIEMEHTTPNRVGPVGFSCGYAAFDTVDASRYSIPFRFTGTIHRVTYDTSGDGLLHDEAEFQALISQQ